VWTRDKSTAACGGTILDVLQSVEVRAPDGVRWTVGRRLLPWRPRRRLAPHRLELGNAPSFGDFTGDDPVSLILGGLTLLLLVIVGVLLLGPAFGLLAFALEWFVAAVVGLLGVLVRLVFGWPFAVVATSERSRYETRVRGWRLSGMVAAQLTQRIRETGQVPGEAPR
jgi:hypothetical protein